MSEMQARWWAELCRGTVKLPSKQTMLDDIVREKVLIIFIIKAFKHFALYKERYEKLKYPYGRDVYFTCLLGMDTVDCVYGLYMICMQLQNVVT